MSHTDTSNDNTGANGAARAEADDCASIHDFDFALICEYFASIDRQGPGSDEATRLALGFTKGIASGSRIADIGCGTGSSALLLAKDTGASVTAIDLFPQFLTRLAERASAAGLADRITTAASSMDALGYADDTFDMIWCEGAIYNIGFEKGLQYWKPMLKGGGYIAVTDATWLTDNRPTEIKAFWRDAYPGITTMAENIRTIQRCGYTPVAAFSLPDACWTSNFYVPQQLAQEAFLARHGSDPTALGLVRNQRHEAELFSRYHQYYGYVFYIARKP